MPTRVTPPGEVSQGAVGAGVVRTAGCARGGRISFQAEPGADRPAAPKGRKTGPYPRHGPALAHRFRISLAGDYLMSEIWKYIKDLWSVVNSARPGGPRGQVG